MYTITLPAYDWHKDGSERAIVSRMALDGTRALEVTLISNPFEGAGYEIYEAVVVDEQWTILEYVNPHLVRLVDSRGSPVVTRHHPLWDTMTTGEVEALFGLADGTAKKACQRGQLPCRKAKGAWLIRYEDAAARWQRDDDSA